MLKPFTQAYEQFFISARHLDGLPALLLRLYLAPVFIQAGWNKWQAFDDTVAWFGNPDWGLGLPMPELMVSLAAGTEIIGGALLIVGFAVRLIAVPLMITMLVAIFTVHWQHGWLAIADASSWLANERVLESVPRREAMISLLKEHGNYGWLTSRGSLTILNNGIEFGVTYFIMLLSLFFTGAGRYISLDYWIVQRLKNDKAG